MYNSLSNIQKHLYSLIKQNNPEYLQQSINEDSVLRSRRPNLANLKVGERLADFEGMDQQHADELRAKRKDGERIRDREAGYKVNAKGETETDGEGKKVVDPELIKKYADKAADKDKNTQAYYNKVLEGLPTDPTKYTEKQAADVAMMKVIYNTTSKKKNEDGSDPNNALNRDTNKGKGAMEKLTSTLSNDTLANLSGVNKKPTTTVNANQRISPMYWVTQNDFETSTGEKYNARNAKHRQLFFDLNSSGESTVSPTAGVGQGPAYDSIESHTMRRRPANIPQFGTPQARYDTVDGTIANTTPQSRGKAQSNADDAAALKRIDAEAAKRDVEIRAEARRIVNGEQQTSRSTQGQQRYPVQNQNGNSDIGIDITQQSPDQIGAMNDPSRGGQSGRFGKPTQRAINNLDIRSEYYNDGGMQNANQAMDLTGKSVNSKVSRIA